MNQKAPVKLKDMRDAYRIEHSPMTLEQSKYFLQATVLDMSIKDPFDASDGELLGGLGMVLWKRLNFYKISISKGLGVVTVAFSDTPGKIVLYTYTWGQMYKERGRMVTTEDFADVFPMGLPTGKASDEIWVAQKGYSHGEEIHGSRNLIDDPVNW